MVFTFDSKKHSHSFMIARETIVMFSKSQGFYSRLLRSMEEQNWLPLYELTKENYFDDTLDFIFFIEG